MSDFFEQLTALLTSLGTWGYLFVALVVFFETVIGVGQFLPGSVFLAFVGFLCYLQTFDLATMGAVVFFAHYLGEQTNYLLGRTKGRALFTEDALVLRRSLLDVVEAQLARWGGLYFLACRFSGVLRPIVSFLAGATHYPWLRFSLWLIPGCLLWAAVHLGIGFALGASWHEAAQYVEEVSLLVAMTVVFFGVAIWASRTSVTWAGATARSLERLARRAAASPFYQRLRNTHPHVFGFLERRLSLSSPWGWGFTVRLSLVAALLLCALALGWLAILSHRLNYMDRAVVNLLCQVRRPFSANLLIFVTYLGEPKILVTLGAAMGVACWITRLRKSAAVFVVAPTVALVACYSAKMAFQRLRPISCDPVQILDGFSFPSTHAGVATAFLFATCFAIWQATQDTRLRTAWASLVTTLALLIAYSRVYLGLHYPTDVLGGVMVGLASFVLSSTLATRLGIQEAPRPVARVLFPSGALLALMLWAHAAAPVNFASNASPSTMPCSREYPNLQAMLPDLPRYATRLTGTPSLAINLITVGDPDRLLKALEARGWQRVPPQAFYTRGIQAPIFPAFVEARPASITMARRALNRREVVRLWETTFCVGGRPVWVGSVIAEKLRQRLFTMEVFKVDPDLDLALERWCEELSACPCELVEGFRERGLYHISHPFFTHGEIGVVDTGLCTTTSPDQEAREQRMQLKPARTSEGNIRRNSSTGRPHAF